MNTIEIEKAAGGILFALILVVGIGMVTDGIDNRLVPHTDTAKQQAAEAAAAAGVKQAPAAAQAAAQPAAASADEDVLKLLPQASAQAGEQAAKKCGACHTFAQGAPNRVGPNLFAVIGRPVASEPGFAYDDALKKLGGNWTETRINTFITSPKAYAPGTKMTFPGDSDAKDRANIIAYLRSISPNAPPPQ